MGGEPQDFYEIVEALSFFQTPAEIMGLIYADREAQKLIQKKEESTKTPKQETKKESTPKEVKIESTPTEVKSETTKKE